MSDEPKVDLPVFDIAKLELRPGDFLVVRLKGTQSRAVFARLGEHINGMLRRDGFNNRSIVIDDTIELSVLTKAEIEELISK